MRPSSATPRNSEVAKQFLDGKQAAQSPSNIDDITRVVGTYIAEEFDCVYTNFAGKLYAGPAALLFRGRVFFFDWSIIIRWEDVIQVKKNERSVEVVVREPKGASHTFEKLFDADKVWNALVNLHNDNILDAPRKTRATPRALSRTLRRNNSDPYAIRAFKFFYSTDDEDSDDEEFLENKRDAKSVCSSTDVSKESDETVTPAEAWSKVMNKDKSSYAYSAVQSCELPCSLATFFDLFIGDDAKKSIPNFMQATGEEDVNSSTWKKDGECMSRIIEYTHPVNAPMAPPKARARKEQEYRQYENHGLVLKTKTIVEDVPMTDCFFVAEMLRAEQLGEDKISISMLFDIRFVKSTMFKSIITRTTKADVEKSMQGLAKYMSKNFGEDVAIQAIPAAGQQENSQPSWESVVTSRAGFLMLVLLLSIQLWMIWKLQSMEHELLELSVSCLRSDTLAALEGGGLLE